MTIEEEARLSEIARRVVGAFGMETVAEAVGVNTEGLGMILAGQGYWPADSGDNLEELEKELVLEELGEPALPEISEAPSVDGGADVADRIGGRGNRPVGWYQREWNSSATLNGRRIEMLYSMLDVARLRASAGGMSVHAYLEVQMLIYKIEISLMWDFKESVPVAGERWDGVRLAREIDERSRMFRVCEENQRSASAARLGGLFRKIRGRKREMSSDELLRSVIGEARMRGSGQTRGTIFADRIGLGPYLPK